MQDVAERTSLLVTYRGLHYAKRVSHVADTEPPYVFNQSEPTFMAFGKKSQLSNPSTEPSR